MGDLIMETFNLLSELRKNGFSVKAENSRLQIAPANNLTDELKQTIKKSKTEILCALHQEKELRRLVRLVSDCHGFTEESYEEALTHALADPVNALTCFISLARHSNLLEKGE